ncbi:helix-turn-helix domain-containing protein, partial [Enterococcus sp. 7E2_DIV0204]|uniref:helix-turn-helix domain-containing protein n=1 Tax=Enterococcus sp. 7E2_DIV0204 TaxID=1834188 RepID=UPI001C3875CE
MGFGLTIRKIREKKGLTQKKVCFDIVTMSYYSRIERDISDPSITIFLKILSRLNITFDEFMFIHNNYIELTEDFFWFNISELY